MILSSCTQTKYDHASKHRGIKIVIPDWILDSVEAEQVLQEEAYHPALSKVSPLPGTCNGRTPLDAEDASPSMPAAITGFSITTEKARIMSEVAEDVEAVVAVEERDEAVTLTICTDKTVSPNSAVQTIPPIEAEKIVCADNRREREEEEGKMKQVETVSPHAQETQFSPSSTRANLLDGITIFFTDYQECIEDDTLDKWKLVSF